MTVDGATVAAVGAGYPGKRRIYERLADLGARVVILDEPGHWSRQLVDDGVAAEWLSVPFTGEADDDAASAVGALAGAGIRPGRRSDVLGGVPAHRAACRGDAGPARQSDRGRRRRAQQATHAGSVERAGLPTPRAQRVQSVDQLFAAAADIGFPAVVKPEFGHSQVGCVRVDSYESLPDVYWLVRNEIASTHVVNLYSRTDLLFEEYLDGVEFDVDLVLEDGECVFSSVSQQFPTHEPSFQETGLHCPPRHAAKPVRRLVELSIETVQAFGFRLGVLHVEGKCTSKGPRIVEVNARMGGGRIHQIVEAVWEVDLIEAHLRAALGLPQELSPSRKPRGAVVNALVYAPATGRLAALPLEEVTPEAEPGLVIDVAAEVGQVVDGPDRVFPTVLADVYVGAKNVRRGESLIAEVLRNPPVVTPVVVRARR